MFKWGQFQENWDGWSPYYEGTPPYHLNVLLKLENLGGRQNMLGKQPMKKTGEAES